MKKYEDFESFLKKNKFRYNPVEFNSNMMYRAKIFNQYGNYYRELDKDSIEYQSLYHDVMKFERDVVYKDKEIIKDIKKEPIPF